jgi:hypothetical protein
MVRDQLDVLNYETINCTPANGNVFHTRMNVIIAAGVARFCTVVGLTEEPLRACMYDDPHTQVSIDYVQDAHRHRLEEICRDEYYLS